ncbi:uncharacterized protein LOC124199543 [Daphnia pulex]|uniref:uncharacterized protein LOC124199543 n=1 Tax=Daphnia pulex TaxID=6669 RepID=UPI001EDF6D72|nr:uncharacterized protein LOC124199543 [Daphnia pulex]XP_046641120.1 uncharacterized protein LOC124326378 [Daphnia pulicaria]
MMHKWSVAMMLCCWMLLLSVSARATASSLDDDNGLDEDFEDVSTKDVQPTARFAFVNLNSDGSLSFTFNATSLQYTLLAALTALVLAAILLPLLGLIGIGSQEPEYGYAYTDQQGYTGTTYDSSPPPSYGSSYGGSSYSKRSLSWMGPVMEALSKSYQKYEMGAGSSRSEEEHHE